MNNSNLVYKAIAEFINELQADRHDIAHAITLLAAQMPNASPSLIQVFLHADGMEVMDNGEMLPRLDSMIDPNSTITTETVEHRGEPKVTTGEMPESDSERPIVRVWEHPHLEDAYQADKHNTKVLCSFHQSMPPAAEDFKRKDATELIIHLGYGHINGGFNIHFYEGEQDSTIQLFGEFTLESFIPVRVELIKKGEQQ